MKPDAATETELLEVLKRFCSVRLHQCVASRDARLGAAVVDVRLQGGAKLTLGGGP